jgi:hypothetical protein
MWTRLNILFVLGLSTLYGNSLGFWPVNFIIGENSQHSLFSGQPDTSAKRIAVIGGYNSIRIRSMIFRVSLQFPKQISISLFISVLVYRSDHILPLESNHWFIGLNAEHPLGPDVVLESMALLFKRPYVLKSVYCVS